MGVELRHLRAFVAVAQQLSFTRAAEHLIVTQPALTRTIKQLEAALEVRLFDRDSRHVALTATGAEFLGRAQQVLTAMDQTLASVRAQVTIRFGFSWLLPDPWAQTTVSAYEKATGNSVSLIRIDDPLAAVDEGTVDVAVVRGTHEPTPGTKVLHLFDELRVAVCSAKCTLAGAERLHWSEVPDWPLVVNTVSGTTGPWSWPDGDGPQRIIETRNFDEWLESVAANRGIGVVPEVAMRRNIHPAVRFVPLIGAPTSPVSIAFQPQHRDRRLRHFIEAAAASAVNCCPIPPQAQIGPPETPRPATRPTPSSPTAPR
ncbi:MULTISPECIES: LysR family transcriptional regulator [unclassified Crossiella]|uniref:LysR family transcriptional regulator n=1 Tax=unclassified Crossiella TaxID=2620835 RepID=UPI0020000ADA|nr:MULTISPECIES: LysR family transcriptional regulator [unclassified Crossiella]MCK2239957.1 LysR family transcriptional regulator [Crossiella sp. S99.2]MCK2252665.1 LysR family transcriptional regulator [Crossiella sp. S99.1]